MHPEGGFFRETYRSNEKIPKTGLPDRYTGDRTFATAIYYLLESGQISALHRIKSDEIWSFHTGSPLSVYAINVSGSLSVLTLGSDPDAGQQLQCLVPANTWFGAKLDTTGGYALVTCFVTPGFEFADFEMGNPVRLLEHFGRHKEIIDQLTHPVRNLSL